MSATPPSPVAQPPAALPAGTRLGEFELRHVLGVGGFAIVYLAFDHTLEREVAVKEYMPTMLAGRTETLHVSLRSQGDAETFALGLKSFVNEARLLARFDLPSLVRVHRFWEANGTAYMAMPVVRGQSAKAWRQAQTQPPDEAWLRALLDPMLDTLEKLHAEAVYHRDIAPDNIQLEEDGRPVLLDLGAARRVIGDATQTLTAILKPAYAPIEQYAEVGALRQGAWTDLYALGATLHYLLLGRPPMPATARALHDELPPLAGQALPGCSRAFAQVVDWMLSPRPQDRPQSVAMLRDALQGRIAPPAQAVVVPAAPVQWERTQRVATEASTAGAATLAAAAVPEGRGAAVDLSLAEADAAATVLHTGAPAAMPPAAQSDRPPGTQSGTQPRPAMATAQAAPTSPAGSRVPVWAGAAVALLLLGGGVAWWAGQDAVPAEAAQLMAAAPTGLAAAASGPLPNAALPASVAGEPPPQAPALQAAPAMGAAATQPAVPPNLGPVAAPAKVDPKPALAQATTAAAARPPPRPAASGQPAAQRGGAVARPAAEPPPGAVTALVDTAPATVAPPAPVQVAPPPASPPALGGSPSEAAPKLVQSPTERCGRRVLIALWNCIDRQCKLPELRSHPECVKLREERDRSVRGPL